MDGLNTALAQTEHKHKNTHTHPFNGPLSVSTRVSQYQKGNTNLDFTEARDSEWQWHQLGHMQICTLLQTDNHASNPPLRFLHAGCPSCRPTNSVRQSTEGISIRNCAKIACHNKNCADLQIICCQSCADHDLNFCNRCSNKCNLYLHSIKSTILPELF